MSIDLVLSDGEIDDRGNVIFEDDEGRLRVQLDCTRDYPGRTKQEFKEECDVNEIVRKNSPKLRGDGSDLVYGDFSNADDYLAAMQAVRTADAGFARLPAEIRDRMGNDPARLLEFVSDEANRPEAEELGLVMRSDKPTPTKPGEIPSDAVDTTPEAGADPA